MPIILEAFFTHPNDSQNEIVLSIDLSTLNLESLKTSLKEYPGMKTRIATCKKMLNGNFFDVAAIWLQEQIGYHGAKKTQNFLTELAKKNSVNAIFSLVFDTVKKEPESKFSSILVDWFLQNHVDKNQILELAEFFKNERCFTVWAFDAGELALINHKSLMDSLIKQQLQQGNDDESFKQWRYDQAKIAIFNQLRDSFAEYQLEIEEPAPKKTF